VNRAPTLSFSRGGENSANVFAPETRKILQYIVFGHPAREILEQIRWRYARPHDTGFAATNPGCDFDEVAPVHGRMLGPRGKSSSTADCASKPADGVIRRPYAVACGSILTFGFPPDFGRSRWPG
jgi:hypothetical protein